MGVRIQKIKSIGIVSTAYNEEKSLERFFEICRELSHDFEILEIVLVNNGSQDRTLEIMKDAQRIFGNLKIVDNPDGQGYGDGITVALKNLSTEFAAIIPTDCQFRLLACKSLFLEYFNSAAGHSDHETIFSVRETRLDGTFNNARGRVWRSIICSITGLPKVLDPASQLKIVCRECALKSTSHSFIWDIEQALIQIRGGFPFKVVKVEFHSRIYGNSSLSIKGNRPEFYAVRQLYNLIRSKKDL